MRQNKWLQLTVIGAMLLLVACGGGDEPAAEVADEAPTATTAPTATAEPEAEDSAVADDDNNDTTATSSEEMGNLTTTDSGLQYEILEEGSGRKPEAGEIVSVHYTGTLEDGTKFDSSVDRNEPISFPLGQGRVIPGWDEGIALLNIGSKARLVIPSDLAYGAQGAGGGIIPPNATLIFEVELVDILAGAPAAPTEVAEADYTTTDSGLMYYDFEEGDGASPETGQQVLVHYTGWLEDGTKFDSSLDRGQPFNFPIGQGRVIQGWDEGVATMKIGGKRQLVIPAQLGYGAQGAGGVIPPNATLIFEVELLAVQ